MSLFVFHFSVQCIYLFHVSKGHKFFFVYFYLFDIDGSLDCFVTSVIDVLNFARGLESEFTIAGSSICVLRVWFEKFNVLVDFFWPNETCEHLLAKNLIMCPFHLAIGYWLWREFCGAIFWNHTWKYQLAHLTYSCPPNAIPGTLHKIVRSIITHMIHQQNLKHLQSSWAEL